MLVALSATKLHSQPLNVEFWFSDLLLDTFSVEVQEVNRDVSRP